MIADVEPILWPARKPAAQIAILMPRSAEAWDLFNLSSTAATGYMHECCVTSSMLAYAADYNAEVFGLYNALATDEGLDVDFIDEDALSDRAALSQYKAIYVTEPNVPSHGLATLLQWAQAGGVLVAVSGAGTFDEYNMPSQTAMATAPRERWCKTDASRLGTHVCSLANKNAWSLRRPSGQLIARPTGRWLPLRTARQHEDMPDAPGARRSARWTCQVLGVRTPRFCSAAQQRRRRCGPGIVRRRLSRGDTEASRPRQPCILPVAAWHLLRLPARPRRRGWLGQPASKHIGAQTMPTCSSH